MKTLATCLFILLAANAGAQDIFNVNSVGNCGGPGSGVTRVLAAGPHHLTLAGAMSNWNYDAANGGKSWLTWVRVRDSATGTIWTFSAGAGRQSTSALAAADVAGLLFEFELTTTSTVSFYFEDTPCGDNRGNVTVFLDDPMVVADKQTSWGSLKSIYR